VFFGLHAALRTALVKMAGGSDDTMSGVCTGRKLRAVVDARDVRSTASLM
jgi:hypothetical protein